jgi:hypothetical protein
MLFALPPARPGANVDLHPMAKLMVGIGCVYPAAAARSFRHEQPGLPQSASRFLSAV